MPGKAYILIQTRNKLNIRRGFMLNDSVKEKIILNRRIGRETTQILLEGDIIVSDQKPDMARLLKTDADVSIDRTDVSADRVNFSGKLHIKVLYLAKVSEKPVHSMSVSMPLEDFINMEGVGRDMWVEVAAKISNIEYKMLNDRKINYRAVIDVDVCADAKTSHDVVTGIEGLPESHLKRSRLNITRTVESKEERFTVKNEMPLPPGKPNIRNILQADVAISNKDIKVVNGRVGISGELTVSTLYSGDDDAVLEFAEHEVPFSGYIEAPGAREGMFGDVVLKVADSVVSATGDDDGEERVISAEVAIMAVVKVVSQSEALVLDDAYYINKQLIFRKESVNFPRLVTRNKNQCPIKEVVQLDQGCPDILQIFRVTGNLLVENVKVFEDRVCVEGIIDADVLYIAKNDDSPLYNFRAVIPYKQTIEAKGATPAMDVTVEHSIDHIGFNMLSEREVEVRYLVCFSLKVMENLEASVITDVELMDMDKSLLDKMASITIYVVQDGDSLWSIAKRYNVGLDDLLSVNDIADADSIYPGQKLLVLKKMPA